MVPRTDPTPNAPTDKGSASTRPTDAARAPLRPEPGPEPLRSSAPEPHASRETAPSASEPDLPSNTSIVRHHAARWLSLISPRYSTWRCTTRPPRTRTFSTTLQYRCSLPSLRRVLQRTNMNKSSAQSAPESRTKVGTTQGIDRDRVQKTETCSVNHSRKSSKHMVSWRSRVSSRRLRAWASMVVCAPFAHVRGGRPPLLCWGLRCCASLASRLPGFVLTLPGRLGPVVCLRTPAPSRGTSTHSGASWKCASSGRARTSSRALVGSAPSLASR